MKFAEIIPSLFSPLENAVAGIRLEKTCICCFELKVYVLKISIIKFNKSVQYGQASPKRSQYIIGFNIAAYGSEIPLFKCHPLPSFSVKMSCFFVCLALILPPCIYLYNFICFACL